MVRVRGTLGFVMILVGGLWSGHIRYTHPPMTEWQILETYWPQYIGIVAVILIGWWLASITWRR